MQTDIVIDMSTPEALQSCAQQIAQAVEPGLVVYLHGGLGAGKTTLVATILRCLGVEEQVTSPSYALLQYYSPVVCPIIHMDLYRLQSADELISLGLRDYLEWQPSPAWFIEWPQPIATGLPAASTHLYLDLDSKCLQRSLRLSATDQKRLGLC